MDVSTFCVPQVKFSTFLHNKKLSSVFSCLCLLFSSAVSYPGSISHASLKKKKSAEVDFSLFGLTECFKAFPEGWRGWGMCCSCSLVCCLPLPLVSLLPAPILLLTSLHGAFLEFLHFFLAGSYPMHACNYTMHSAALLFLSCFVQ